MALQSSDLLVVQSQTDSKQYKLRISDLETFLEGSAGIQFRGTADLNLPPTSQTPPITAPTNGDLYLVEFTTSTIHPNWVIKDSPSTAQENDRIVWDSSESEWILVSAGSGGGGTVTGIIATLPLKTDGSTTSPVISVNKARTQTAATGASDTDGPIGVVERLAEAADVVAATGTGATDAVVTADLLKATNTEIVSTQGDINNINIEIDGIQVEINDIKAEINDLDSEIDNITFPVTSVNTKTGDVVLTATDVGALPDTYTPPVTSVNSKTGVVVLTADDVGALESGDKISLLDNDAGYITLAEVPTPTLDEVTTEGSTTTNSIEVGGVTCTTVSASGAISTDTTVAATGNITAGTGANQILLTAATGEITGGANVFIDGGSKSLGGDEVDYPDA